jgi:hypothetical protein
MMKMPPPVASRSLESCEEMRPQAGVGKLKHAPPMQTTDLPVVAQAVSPANRTCPLGAEAVDATRPFSRKTSR